MPAKMLDGTRARSPALMVHPTKEAEMSAQQIPEHQAAGLALSARRGLTSKWYLQGRAREMYDTLSMEELKAIAEPDEDSETGQNPR
jgi:hypothetical protein